MVKQSSRGCVLEHLMSSGTKVTSGPVVCKLCGEGVDLSYVSYVGKKWTCRM